VTVTAEAIQTTVSQPDAVINETAINNLPINGRRFQDFATLTPTAQVDPQRGQISLSGQRGIYGTNIMPSPSRRSPSKSSRLSPPAIRPSSDVRPVASSQS
jgi:hypothetical protein